jgi:hypothetical protein
LTNWQVDEIASQWILMKAVKTATKRQVDKMAIQQNRK